MFRHHDDRGEAAGPNVYQMRQQMFAIGDDFWIENGAGQRAFKVDGKALRIRKTLVLEDVTVPRHRVISFADAAAGCAPGARLYRNPLFAVPVYAQVSACLAATAVGAAAGAVEDFVAMTRDRRPRFSRLRSGTSGSGISLPSAGTNSA